jgi:hypothetical protein
MISGVLVARAREGGNFYIETATVSPRDDFAASGGQEPMAPGTPL